MKENELFEEKLKLQEKVAKMKNNGSSWLELFFTRSPPVGNPQKWLCSARGGGRRRQTAVCGGLDFLVGEPAGIRTQNQ
ncbi:MAG: hypothetical protein AAB960_01930 [Patescibacteria group bacterium]